MVSHDSLFAPMSFTRGPAMKNRFMLAPLTNWQSHDDGTLSDEEKRWLVMRAEGGFGATMTCAAHVQKVGQGFPGQLGVFDDEHVAGLSGLASAISAHGSRSLMQLHHAGNRSPKELIGTDPVSSSDDPETGARALSTSEVKQLTEDFVAAAVRADRAGFDGIELHGAHGYVICQFLSPERNSRDDRYGGSLENRSRLLFDILEGIRSRCRADFTVGVRISPERFGITMAESTALASRLMASGLIDFLDMSLWDCFKAPNEDDYKGRPLIDWFTELDRHDVRLGVAGKLYQPEHTAKALEHGADFVLLGRMGILHHDYPNRLQADAAFTPVATPVTSAYLRNEGLTKPFIDYMTTWKGFIDDSAG